MKRIATLLLAIVMLVSVMAPITILADTEDERPTVYLYTDTKNATTTHNSSATVDKSKLLTVTKGDVLIEGGELIAGTVKLNGSWSGPSGAAKNIHNGILGEATTYTSTAGNYVDFCADGLMPGWYDVYFLEIRQAGNSGTGVTFTAQVKHKTGTSEVYTSSGSPSTRYWTGLGSYEFTGGSTNEYVRLAVQNGILRISSVLFIPVPAPAEANEQTATATVSSPADWEKTEDGFKTSVAGASADFIPEEALANRGYALYYDYVPSNEPVSVKFTISHSGAEQTQEFVYNYGQGNYTYENEKTSLYLGQYPFTGTGAEKVTVTKIKGNGELNVSNVKYVPVTNASVMLPNVMLAENIVTFEQRINGDDITGWNSNKTEGWEQTASFTGVPSWTRNSDGGFMRFDSASLSAGYYDIYWYQIVDEASAQTDDIKAIIYHNGERTEETISNVGKPVGTTEWVQIGDEPIYFAGGAGNEIISIGGTTKSYRGAGIKLVPNTDMKQDLFHIDNYDANLIEGRWGEGSLLDWDGSKMGYTNNPGQPMTYLANDIEEGVWNVSFWTKLNNTITDEDPSFAITHDGKMDWISVDVAEYLAEGESGWISLGDYYFSGNGNEGVTIYGGLDHEKNVLQDVKAGKPEQGTRLNGTSVRAGSVRFTKAKEQPVGHKLYVPPTKTTGVNFAKSTNLSVSGHATGLIDGVFHVYSAANATLKYYLPNYGTGSVKGRYRVYTNIINISGSESTDIKVNVKHNGVIDPAEAINSQSITKGTNQLKEIGVYEFEGHGADEYVELSNTTGTLARYGAVIFELVENMESESSQVTTPTGTIDCTATINDGKSEMIPYPYDKTTEETTPNIDNTGEHLAVRASVFNGTEDEIVAPLVYAVAYTADGKALKAVKKLETRIQTIPSCASAYYLDYITRTYYEPGDVVKIFVWEAETLKPLLTTPATLSIVEGTWAPAIDISTKAEE